MRAGGATLGLGHGRFARAMRNLRRVSAAPELSSGAAMVAWIVWLIVAAVLGVAELVTFTFALGLIAVGACVAAGVAALQLGLPFQLLAFPLSSPPRPPPLPRPSPAPGGTCGSRRC